MLKEQILDEIITKYYDNQMSDFERINFEARLATSEGMRKYANNQCFEFYKISNSIKLVKNRLNQNRAKLNIFKLIVNVDTVRFKRFYKHLRNRFLNILRHNSK